MVENKRNRIVQTIQNLRGRDKEFTARLLEKHPVATLVGFALYGLGMVILTGAALR